MPDLSRLAAPILGLAAFLVAECSADAADAPAGTSAPDKSGYTLFNPTPDALMRAFEPERPAKASNPFTVDAGHFQIETDLFNYTHTNSLDAGNQFYETADPTLKLGVTNWMDVEVNFNAYQNSLTHSNLTGALLANGHGFGDTIFKVKVNAFGNDGGAVALGFIPYIKVPSAAPGLGNGVVEGGLIAPLQINLPQDFSLVLQTEFDALKDANDSRRHANFVNLASLTHPLSFISKDLSVTVEFYSAVGTDSATPAVYTFDAGLAYLITPNLQLDVGANFGLTKASPDVNVYTGVSARF
ncbi:transporter [Methylocapsa palsarum]|uniref:Putative MetA-pathway of phenol degradation n=1 Tax=Methylocapsa palsarum TaxID=1612308 RepID=A0A1I3XKR1_9HYPH|nr:transporter [Methylocapsa palsarum]SFK20060.1 Putative MetA-pathway of phenol degradation [Methylocapsa palsarum]